MIIRHYLKTLVLTTMLLASYCVASEQTPIPTTAIVGFDETECILEINTLKSIVKRMPNLPPNTIVVLDIDDVIMTKYYLRTYKASEEWEKHIKAFLQENGYSDEDALALIDTYAYEATHHNKTVELVESNIPTILAQIQKRFPIIFLTARSPGSLEYTIQQLNSLLAQRPCLTNTIIPNNTPLDLSVTDHVYPIRYAQGVCCVGAKNTKGASFIALCKRLNLKPDFVVFADDQLPNIDSVTKALQEADIKEQCFYFTCIEEEQQNKSFDPQKAIKRFTRWLKKYEQKMIKAQLHEPMATLSFYTTDEKEQKQNDDDGNNEVSEILRSISRT